MNLHRRILAAGIATALPSACGGAADMGDTTGAFSPVGFIGPGVPLKPTPEGT
ncbi:hypothetical protein [Luteimonas terricola]|uniref:Uncharacterized protein n=1 Tax=Luteimonas terricola TaxID=645597 RepID=A0ABQ2EE25_9GAMM|nr:hypothetical protein [Luteimonas terricola]GGK03773.1 hypothetical protein GCM10011394_10940 [Luteimonas terricola]